MAAWAGPDGPFWRMASYGYPSPFGGSRAVTAWETFQAFESGADYGALKDELLASRGISSHASESWKAAFERFGLVSVLSATNTVTVSEAGSALRAAGEAGDRLAFARTGVGALARIPLGGYRRGVGVSSDLAPHSYLLQALIAFGGVLWWEEISGILARVRNSTEAMQGLEAIKTLRENPSLAGGLDLAPPGGDYNAVRQAVVQSGLNYLLYKETTQFGPYGGTTPGVRLVEEFRPIVEAMLATTPPAARTSFVSESSYFSYVGAAVPEPSVLPAASPAPVAPTTGPSTPVVTTVPVEASKIDEYVARQSPVNETTTALRREAKLVERYIAFLAAQQLSTSRHAIALPTGVLYTDVFIDSIDLLVEAKASASRESVRLALGQVLDYARYVPHKRKAVLLPGRPAEDLIELLWLYDVGCVYETEKGVFESAFPGV